MTIIKSESKVAALSRAFTIVFSYSAQFMCKIVMSAFTLPDKFPSHEDEVAITNHTEATMKLLRLAQRIKFG